MGMGPRRDSRSSTIQHEAALLEAVAHTHLVFGWPRGLEVRGSSSGLSLLVAEAHRLHWLEIGATGLLDVCSLCFFEGFVHIFGHFGYVGLAFGQSFQCAGDLVG